MGLVEGLRLTCIRMEQMRDSDPDLSAFDQSYRGLVTALTVGVKCCNRVKKNNCSCEGSYSHKRSKKCKIHRFLILYFFRKNKVRKSFRASVTHVTISSSTCSKHSLYLIIIIPRIFFLTSYGY